MKLPGHGQVSWAGTSSTEYDPVAQPTTPSHLDLEKSLPPPGRPLRRFYFRSIVGVLGPLIVTAYFLAIWRIYLIPADPHSPLFFGPPGATWVFYSWFVAGVVGLNLSLYGIAGVEAAMLMEPAWGAGDAMRLMMHADSSWSGPAGWLRTARRLVRLKRASGRSKMPGKLWFVLALPSLLIFAAWPLSGLSFETTQGYVHGRAGGGEPSTVTGFSFDNFNERNEDDAKVGAALTWGNALDARVPGRGIVYTPKGYDRSQHPFLEKLPTILPTDDGVSRIFLTAQAQNPIEGNSWGLLMQYNCSIVKSPSDLTVLNYRNVTEAEMKNSIFVRKKQDTDVRASNMHATIEVGTQSWPNSSATERMTDEDPNAVFTKTTSCYFNEAQNVTGDYPGIDQETVFEVLLYQLIFNQSYADPRPNYNFSLDHNITEFYGGYDYTDFDKPKNISVNATDPWTAIGARCTSSSSVGTADIDGLRSTYSNFVRTDTPISVQRARCAGRFGAEALSSFIIPSDGDLMGNLFGSVAAPPAFYAPFTNDPNNIDVGTGLFLQLNYLQAEQLRQSMLRAHAAYAVQLMYNGGQGFTALDGSHVKSVNPNITEFVQGTVLKPGVVPASLPITLFFIWALVGPTLTIMYGFRRRWTAVLDGYSLFRIGVDLPYEYRERIAANTNTGEVEECHELNNLPGLVGDMKPHDQVGHVGLVERSPAPKEKSYR
ncbi:hypothetical protein EJ04DRAFT_570794 [Polyplosphaeria fusca]|uniref:Uncharacterized protein n=1 Tax=Polyplosphaeria fusca TaxID=682080 RepID=A0A9P4QIB6_9PLEO|nr:hypothetical protein EJ04DRAFT_570794 [Polyplosphaeria fusca]